MRVGGRVRVRVGRGEGEGREGGEGGLKSVRL